MAGMSAHRRTNFTEEELAFLLPLRSYLSTKYRAPRCPSRRNSDLDSATDKNDGPEHGLHNNAD